MTKKFFILPLLGATLCFATWGYFPFKASDDGFAVKASHFITFGDEDVHQFDLNARYVLGSTLEIALMDLGFRFTDPSGLQNPIASLRFQFSEKNLLFLEGTLPIGPLENPIYVHAGLQHALVLSKHSAWSAELGVNYLVGTRIEYSDDYKITEKQGVELNLATEADFNAKPSFIWFVGAEVKTMVLDNKIVEDDFRFGYAEEKYAGDLYDFGVRGFGGFNIEIMEHAFIEEELSLQVYGIGKYDYSSFAFKTSLKYSF